MILPAGCDDLSVIECRYADGSGNLYRVGGGSEKMIEYIPVKPEFSSSGLYDGGAPVTRSLTGEQYGLIVSGFKRSFAARSSHIANRVKMSGLVVIRDRRGERSIILAPRSKEQADIEKLLKSVTR